MMPEEVRPWGSFEVLLDETGYKVKRLLVLPGKRLSLQLHHHRCEHWYVVAGEGIVTVGDEELFVQRGSSVDVPRQAKHRIANMGEGPLVIIEVQQGDRLEEDDIVRFEDDYGRLSS